jgi:hypothetical protein
VITRGLSALSGSFPAAEGGAAYRPATDTWRPLAAAGQPPLGAFLRAAWSGEKVLYWGFLDADAVGASYDPVADAWAPIDATAAPSLVNPRAFWTGADLLVWGEARGRAEGLGARWTPGGAAWRPIANAAGEEAYAAAGAASVWTGRELVVWGGNTSDGALAEGFVYDAADDVWRPTVRLSQDERRTRHVAVWTGGEMLVWGGFRPDDGMYVASGWRYRLAGAPSP